MGLAGTVAGAQLLLTGALDLADRAGLGERVRRCHVGGDRHLVAGAGDRRAVGSTRRDRPDRRQPVGSNLFNALAVAGLAAIIAPAPLVDAANLTTVAAGAALVVAIVAWATMRTGYLISRREGIVLVIGYLVMVPFLT